MIVARVQLLFSLNTLADTLEQVVQAMQWLKILKVDCLNLVCFFIFGFSLARVWFEFNLLLPIQILNGL